MGRRWAGRSRMRVTADTLGTIYLQAQADRAEARS